MRRAKTGGHIEYMSYARNPRNNLFDARCKPLACATCSEVVKHIKLHCNIHIYNVAK